MTVKGKFPKYSTIAELATERATDIAVSRVQQEAVDTAPAQTGDLRRNIVPDFNKKEVRSEKNYSAAVEYGTAPHTIEAKNAKALRFTKGGKTIFAKKVNHPGTKPQPFMRLSARKVQKEISLIFKRELDKLK